MDRLGLVAVENERLRAELRRYGGPTALLAAATLAVVLVRVTTAAPARPHPAAHAAARLAPAPKHAAAPLRHYYAVASGDTLGLIAGRLHTTVSRLLALNPGVDPTALHVGQRIRVR